MKNLDYDKPLYILPFDHRSSFELKMFGWGDDLAPEQTAQIAAVKQVIYAGFKAAIQALNSGSSSQKTCLYEIGETLHIDPPPCLWEGKTE